MQMRWAVARSVQHGEAVADSRPDVSSRPVGSVDVLLGVEIDATSS